MYPGRAASQSLFLRGFMVLTPNAREHGDAILAALERQHIDLAGSDVVEQGLQGRAFQRPAGELRRLRLQINARYVKQLRNGREASVPFVSQSWDGCQALGRP